MMKRTKTSTEKIMAVTLFLVLLLLLLSFTRIKCVAQTSTVLRISPASLEVDAGSDFEVDALIETSSDVFYYGIILVYDASVMESLNISVFAPFDLTNRIVDKQIGFLLVEGEGGPSSGVVPLASFAFHCSSVGQSVLRIADYYVDDHDFVPVPVDRVIDGVVVQWLFKTECADYAISGVPDFDQRQTGWRNPRSNAWSWSGPTAVADGLWWLDSFYEPNFVAPPLVSDGLSLVHAYGSWDDHDVQNVPPLIQDLAWHMDTDGNGTGQDRNGTDVNDMVEGLEAYFSEAGMRDKLSANAMKAPTFDDIRREVERGDVLVLLLGFWQEQPAGSGTSVRVGGHYVAVSGIDPTNRRVALSDPYNNNAEATGAGFVSPSASHNHLTEAQDTLHNDAAYVSHDSYNVTYDPRQGNGSPIGVLFNPTYLVDLVNETQGQNTPQEFESLQGAFDPLLGVETEVEYAVVVSPRTGLVAAGTQNGEVNIWDFYGSSQWSWNSGNPIISLAMTNDGRYVLAGSRSSSVPVNGSLVLFDNSLGSPPSNLLWSVPLSVSKSDFGNLSGIESESVDVKNNTFNGFVLAAAGTDSGLLLFDYQGNVIWNYSDGSAENMVRFSDDGNYLVCSDFNSGVIHYFSSLRDGVAGWNAGDGMPMWSYGGAVSGLYAYWISLDGLGERVAASMYPAPVSMSQNSSRVILLDGTGTALWTRGLSRGGFVKVEVSCDGKRVAAVNSDPSDTVGCDLTYWSQLADGLPGWGVDDSIPSWVFWPGKELDLLRSVSDDFYAMGISQDGGSVVAGGRSSNAYFLSSNGEGISNVTSFQGVVESVDLTFDGKYSVMGDNADTVRLFDSVTGLKWSTAVNGGVTSVALSRVYPILSSTTELDVAVINVTGCKDGCDPVSTVTQNYTCHFLVEVENHGDLTASVTVLIRANNSLIGTMTMNVSAGERRFVPFIWNTTGFVRGNYMVTGFAEILQDETDVGDNSFTDVYSVKLCGVGDVNGDGRVDQRDVGFISASYSATPGTVKWNPNADVNDDHIVDMRDLGIVCNNYGKNYT